LIAMIVEIDGAQSTIFTVSEIANGRALRADSFAHDQLTDAHDLLDRRWIESAPHEAAMCDASKQFRHVMALGDHDDVRNFMADGVVRVDHRSLGAGHRDTDQVSDSTGPLAGPVMVLVRKLIAHSGPLILTWASGTTADGDEYRDDLTLHRIDENGRFDIWETFPLDQLETARHRFAEVDTASALSRADRAAVKNRVESAQEEPVIAKLTNNAWEICEQAGSTSGLEPNAAWRVVERVIDSLQAGDFDRYEGFHTEDFCSISHERLAPTDNLTLNRREYLDATRALLALGDTRSFVPDLLATRGDHLCLMRSTTQIDDGLVERVVVVSTRDGQINRLAWYEPADLDEALEELDRR
jgi:hypothetical protein